MAGRLSGSTWPNVGERARSQSQAGAVWRRQGYRRDDLLKLIEDLT
jgi:hypothetical protein